MKIDRVLFLEGLLVRETVLRLFSDPNLAMAAAVLGMFLIYWELLRPGSVLPGSCGAILVLVGLHAVTVTWVRKQPDLWLVLALLLPWGMVTTLLVRTGRRARRNKSVEHPSGSLRNWPI